MINFSRLAQANEEIKTWILILQALRQSNQINYKSRYFVLFASTLISSLGIGIYFFLKNLVHKYMDKIRQQKLIRPNLIRQSSTILQNGSREIFVQNASGRLTRIIIAKPKLDRYAADKYLYKNFEQTQKLIETHKKRVIVNSRFINQLIIIWRILIPRIYSKNSYLLISQCGFLILRTWLSLLVAKLDGQIVKNLIAGNGKKFSRDLIYWILIAFPASYTNAAIKYLDNRLALSFRTNLTRYIHDMYLDKKMAYYKISNLDIQNIDQYITADVAKFSLSLAKLFSSMGKPFIDIIFFAVYLRDTLGSGAIIGIFINYFLTAFLLKKATPKFGQLVAKNTILEGVYFNQHLNVMNNSEEIGFYKGSLIEKSKLIANFSKLTSHINKEINAAFLYNIIEDYILKYTWSAWGYIFSGLPIILDEVFPKKNTKNVPVNQKHNMRQFITNKRLMLSLADAGSRLMYSIKDVSELTGYTDRVFTLLSSLHRVHSPRYDYGDQFGIKDINGTIQQNYTNGIRFEHFPVIIPTTNGSEATPLVRDLNFKISGNKNLLILGSNGSGKTSIARIMAGLWPLYSGLLSKPSEDDTFFLPQKTYFTAGNLRDQIIYPYSYDDMIEMGYNDDYLYHILCEVKLDYLLSREGNFNVIKDWKDVFSGGEKQRVSIARILFKNPKLVILDEATNAVSTDVEDYLFELLQKKKIAFITLSHRPLLMKYHDFVLEIKENAGWKLHDLTSEENLLTIDNEIHDIEEQLNSVKQWESRKQDIELFLDGKYDNLVEPKDEDLIGKSTVELSTEH